MTGQKLPEKFYINERVEEVAEQLLGKTLCSNIHNRLTTGIIVETEAYAGKNDLASHAKNGKLTARNAVMHECGGLTYVYLCYGMHHLFNVVTNKRGTGDAVLIRALQPLFGIETMIERRDKLSVGFWLSSGPALLSQAMGITTALNGVSLLSDIVWIEDAGLSVQISDIVTGPRVGVAYAGKDALRPWRFRIKDNPWCSKAK